MSEADLPAGGRRGHWRALAAWVAFSARASPLLVIVHLVVVVLETLGPLLQAYALKGVIDAVIAHDPPRATDWAIVVVAGFVVRMAALAFTSSTESTINDRMHALLQQEILVRTSSIPGIEHHEMPAVADRVGLLRQQSRDMGYGAVGLVGTLAIVVDAGGVVVLLAAVHPLLLVLPALGLIRVWAAGASGRLLHEAHRANAPRRRLRERIAGIASGADAGVEVRTFALDVPLLRRTAETLELERTTLRDAGRRGMLPDITARVVFGIAYGVAILWVVGQARHGSLPVGDIALLVLLAGRVDSSASSLAAAVRGVAWSLRSWSSLVWLRDYAAANAWPGGASPPERLRHGISLRGVGFRYPSTARPVLAGIDLELAAGSTVALVGENGAGKTTLVKLLARLYDPTEGTVLVDGADLRSLDVDAWRSRLSAGFQDFARFSFTAAESIGTGDLGHLDDPAALGRAAELGDAADVVRRLRDGLATQLGAEFAGGVGLSGGQWQRIALARAFMRPAPVLLLLDEPTSALDPEAEHRLFASFAAVARDAAASTGGVTVLVSHRLSTVRTADLVVVLHEGRIVERGTHDELIRAGGRYCELFDLQSRAYRP